MAKIKEETLFQKEERLKKRKQSFKMTYRKGLFWSDKEKLCQFIMQDEVLIKIHFAGNLDDDTEFCNVTVEGMQPDKIKS